MKFIIKAVKSDDSTMHKLQRVKVFVEHDDFYAVNRAITQIHHQLTNQNDVKGMLEDRVPCHKNGHSYTFSFMYVDNEYHLEQFGTWDEYKKRIKQRLEQIIIGTDFQRETNTSLMKTVYAIAKEKRLVAGFEKIKEYFIPETFDVYQLVKYEFDFRAVVTYGSEGTWLDCYLHGDFGVPGKKYLGMGTFKTLNDTMDAAKVMGELGGILTYLEREYVNKNISRFAPDLKREVNQVEIL